MPLTTQAIRENSTVKKCHFKGCFSIVPHLQLRCIKDLSNQRPPIKKDEIVHATKFDESGTSPDTIHLVGKAFWWHIENFEIAE